MSTPNHQDSLVREGVPTEGRPVDQSERCDLVRVEGWLRCAAAAGVPLVAIQQRGWNEPPTFGWNDPPGTAAARGLTVEEALAAIGGGDNVAVGSSGSIFLVDADSDEAIGRVRGAMGGVRTLSTWTPRGLQLVLRAPGGVVVRQVTSHVMGIDTRGTGGRGYGMAPGSYRTADSYRGKWGRKGLTAEQAKEFNAAVKSLRGPRRWALVTRWTKVGWEQLSDEEKAKHQATLPQHVGPWYYKVADIAEVAEAPAAVMRILEEEIPAAEAAEKVARRKRHRIDKAIAGLAALADERVGGEAEAVHGYDFDLDALKEMLEYLTPAPERAERWGIVAGIKDRFGDAGRAAADAWCQTRPESYDAEDFARFWDNIDDRAGGATFGTVVWAAREAGYRPVGYGARRKLSEKDEQGLPNVRLLAGKRREWLPTIVEAVRDRGLLDDRSSLYAPVSIVRRTSATGADSGLMRLRSVQGRLVMHDGSEYVEGTGGVLHPPGSLIAEVASMAAVRGKIDESVSLWRMDAKTGLWKPTDASADLAAMFCEQAKEMITCFRTLTGMVDSPVMRADGSVLDRAGYDKATGLYADFDPAVWDCVLASPSREDAAAAGKLLLDVLADTPFKSDADRGVYLSLVLSTLARDYVAGNVPMHLFSANQRGAGKGTVVDVAVIIATGRPATIITAVNREIGDSRSKSSADEEDRKLLVALGLSGARVASFDNIPAGSPIGSPAIEGALTAGGDNSLGFYGGRLLGQSADVEVSWRLVLAATGNNLEVGGDMPRRVLMSVLSTEYEAPETEADYSTHPNVLEYAKAERPRLLAAALTLLRAHRVAVAREEVKPISPKVGSFGGWSDRVRSAIVWALGDGFDPYLTQERLIRVENTERTVAMAVLELWHSKFGSADKHIKKDILGCSEEPDMGPLVEAINDLPIRAAKDAKFNHIAFGRWLSARKNAPGPYIVRAGDARRTWRVEKRDADAVPVVHGGNGVGLNGDGAAAAAYFEAGAPEAPDLGRPVLGACEACGTRVETRQERDGKMLCLVCIDNLDTRQGELVARDFDKEVWRD